MRLAHLSTNHTAAGERKIWDGSRGPSSWWGTVAAWERRRLVCGSAGANAPARAVRGMSIRRTGAGEDARAPRATNCFPLKDEDPPRTSFRQAARPASHHAGRGMLRPMRLMFPPAALYSWLTAASFGITLQPLSGSRGQSRAITQDRRNRPAHCVILGTLLFTGPRPSPRTCHAAPPAGSRTHRIPRFAETAEVYRLRSEALWPSNEGEGCGWTV